MWKRLRLLMFMAVMGLAAALATPAMAQLVDVGVPISPHGYPVWYEDSNGLKLELCLPPPAGNASRPDLCIGDPLDEGSELIVVGESFWWLVATEVPTSVGDAKLTLALEATFGGNEEPIDGQQISFGRTRIRIDTPVAGTYTVIQPFATHVFEVTDPGEGINYTADIGASNFLFPASGFRGALSAPIGPFLTWPNFNQNESLQVRDEVTNEVLEQYIGNPSVLSTVVGGTNGNVFRVNGPPGSNLDGNGNDFVETNLFFVMGKVFDETVAFTAHEFPGAPPQNLFAVGPVNRVGFFADPDPVAPLVEVTGVDYNYAVGYPLWYQENLGTLEEPIGGLQLTLCTPGDAMCISDPIGLSDTAQVLLRTGGEGFWWSADARFDIGNDRALLVLGLEATFGGDESIEDGNQITFGRVRIRIDTNVSGAGTYRVTHPYGVNIFEADDSGINYTADIGIADPADPDSAMVGALYSDIGPTFLRWTTFNEDPEFTDPLLVRPNGNNLELNDYHVGNPGVERPVTGSPFDTNFFRVERLVSGDPETGNYEVIGQTSLFAVSGKLFDWDTFEFSESIVPPGFPLANPDSATLDLSQVPAPTSVTIDVLANDEPVQPPALIAGVIQPENGTVVVAQDLSDLTYTPSPAFALSGGDDTFNYNFIDETGLLSNNALVTVTVIAAPPAPETITVSRARLQLNKLRWDITGTSDRPGSTLSIYPGPAAGGTAIGTAVVQNNGRWRVRATTTTNPDVTTISIVSSSGAELLSQPLQVR